MGNSKGIAKKLKALEIDLEGRLTLNGNPASAVPIGRPDIAFVDKEARTRGHLRHGDHGNFEQTTMIPEGADAYVLSKRAAQDYAAVQFYKFQKD